MNDVALLPLFDMSEPTAAYRRNSATSLNAATKATVGLNALRLRVLQAIASWGAATPDEIAARLNLHILKVRPRFSELAGEKGGLFMLEPTGERRLSALGNPQDVFRLTKRGEDALKDAVDSFHVSTPRRKADAVSMSNAG